MTDHIIYMDNAATTATRPEVLEAMLPYFTQHYGNPSSIHSVGRDARRAVEKARQQVAAALGAQPREIYFTAGGSESDNWAIRCASKALAAKGKHIITSQIEHHAVLHTCQYLEKRGYEVTYLDVDENHHIRGIYVTPQMISQIKGGRAGVKPSGLPDEFVPCTTLIVAIGQNIETEHFEKAGLPVERGKIMAEKFGGFSNLPGVFAGGDCATGPATVIRAIAAAKVVAANIDEYLGYHHEITCDVEIPEPNLDDRVPCGRVELPEREACERIHDFDGVEQCMTCQEAQQEANRCLRCDHFGFGIFKGGREKVW